MSVKGLSKGYINKVIDKLKKYNWSSFTENNKYFYLGLKRSNKVVKIWKYK
ncbi:MAG: hypothetical protein GF317_23125 [Candidatus Lokiarchaeota archaeon]|nr:hypothetical protein [Candidatus Lokiarchaeota archaeon]